MQIREQGNKIQLLRSVYDPATKKCKQILIGSMNRWRSENPSNELLSKLKDSEITALNNHLKDKADSRNTYINKVALMNAEETISVITKSILLSEAMTENKLIAIKSGIKQLQKSLKQVEVTQTGSASPAVGETVPLQAITAFGVNAIPTEDEELELSQIIKSFNDKHGTSFTEDDMIRFGQHASKVADEMKSTIMNNPLDVTLDSFADKLLDKMLEASQNNQAVDSIMTTDAESWRSIASLLLRHNKRRFGEGVGGRV